MKKLKYLIRKRALGDVLWIEPVIRSLSQKYDYLIVHTKYNALFENYPVKNVHFKNNLSFWEKCLVNIERLLGISRYTINLDLAYEKNPGIHFLNAYQQKAKIPLTEEYPRIYLTEQEKSERIVDGKYVVLHLESFASKNYRKIFGVNWNEVVSFISENGYKVVQLGIKEEPLRNTIAVKTSIRKMMSLIYKADLFIGLDSGPSHIAACLGTPSLVLFGPVNPLLRHFPDKFRGILMKQPCDKACNNNETSDLQDSFCAVPKDTDIPKCCIYTTSMVLSELKILLQKNDSKVYQ